MREAPTAVGVAEFMVVYVHEHPMMYSDMIAQLILRHFGEAFVARDEAGAVGPSPEVLTAVKRVAKDEVVWATHSLYWRLCQPGDGPGRRVRE
jgi:hypothetical protein